MMDAVDRMGNIARHTPFKEETLPQIRVQFIKGFNSTRPSKRCDYLSSGVLVVLQQIEDWSTGEVPETVKAGKRKLQEGFTTATRIKKPRTLDSTDENQRSKLELARRKVKPRPKAETTITTPTWSKRRNRGFPGGAGGAGDPSKLTTHDAWYLSCVVSLEAPNCEARDPCIT
ncbi:hypothetical protein Focb16_v007779 [Fusarium oxysporum f. sp. cubense]|uniref:Uncharacterized protein n=1 Tax=Fusarium oxysporum f. sp. cubense TaxID=61366 RepID=A0A559LPT7_FUSOC|nr:hypothetical protein Focb16_v007779 [Fusarium oxysporum f. sp. cubense]